MVLKKATALVADDEPLLREALVRQLATAWPELEVVAQARNGREAVEMFERASALEPADFRPPLQLVWIFKTLGRDAESREAEARTAALRAIRAR